jgi:hypothetical protein
MNILKNILNDKKNNMEIKIQTSVTLSGSYGVDFVTIEMTEEDLIELAKKKALENVDSSWYSEAECDEIESVSTSS